jgi:hypothetical protein
MICPLDPAATSTAPALTLVPLDKIPALPKRDLIRRLKGTAELSASLFGDKAISGRQKRLLSSGLRLASADMEDQSRVPFSLIMP